jgi:hypothetical protein
MRKSNGDAEGFNRYRKARHLANQIFEVSKQFPVGEKFSLTSQYDEVSGKIYLEKVKLQTANCKPGTILHFPKFSLGLFSNL